jgi:hypothetical protein
MQPVFSKRINLKLIASAEAKCKTQAQNLSAELKFAQITFMEIKFELMGNTCETLPT